MKNKVIYIIDEMIQDANNSMYPDKGQLDMKEFNIFSCGKASLEIAKSRIQSLPDDDWIAVTDKEKPKRDLIKLFNGFMSEKDKLSEKYRKEGNDSLAEYFSGMTDGYGEVLSYME